jgi:hypothetical protein
VTFGFALSRPSGSPEMDTNVKMRKLVATSTGMLYRSRRTMYVSIGPGGGRGGA